LELAVGRDVSCGSTPLLRSASRVALALAAGVFAGCESSGITLFAQVFLILVAVSLVAALWLRFAAQRGWLGVRAAESRMEVLERVAIGTRSELVAARVLDHVVVLAITPSGVSRVDRVPLTSWKARAFAEVLANTTQHPGTTADPKPSRPAADTPAEDDDDLVC
jgi:flagellar biogenesis protein FliO